MNWHNLIAGAALLGSAVCFIGFMMKAMEKVDVPPEVVNGAVDKAIEAKGITPTTFDPAIVAAVAKALAEALNDIKPMLVLLIATILFLLLAGEAAPVWQIVGSTTPVQADNVTQENSSGNAQEPENGQNESGNMGNGAQGDNATNVEGG
jgi:hypothetical protein